MIPSTRWVCLSCGASNPPGIGVCTACNLSAAATTAEIERGRSAMGVDARLPIEVVVKEPTAINDISRAALVWPPLVPVALLLLLYLSELGGVNLNIHGGAGILLFCIIIWSVVAVIAELILVPRAIFHLAKNQSLRTAQNILAIGFAALFVVVIPLWLLNSR